MLGKIVTVVSYCGSVFVAALALMTAVDVVGRYALNKPIRGGLELTELMLVVIVACGVVVTTAEDNHISVDSVFEKMPPRGKEILLAIAGIIGILVFGVLAWQGGIGVINAIRDSELTDMLKIALFPFKFVLAIGFFISLLISIDRIVRSFLIKKRDSGQGDSYSF